MDDTDFKSVETSLLKINKVVEQMDPAVRVATFDLLAARYLGKATVAAAKRAPAGDPMSDANDAHDTSDLGSFISSFETKKPADALFVLVAWLYSKYGANPMSLKEIKELADSCGLTIPARPDMTFKGAKNAGKSLFAQSGKNWKLTISGELHMKETYKVSKGSTPLPEE